MKRALVLLFIAIFPICFCHAQSHIDIRGKVVDNKSSDAVPLASINLKGTYVTNVSNEEGFFTLKIPAGTSPDAVISISGPGYVNSEYPVSEFTELGADMYLRIPLLPFNLPLGSSVSNAVDPELLLLSAYSMVPENYASEPVGMTAFYRETIKKGNSSHIILNEAVLNIEKSSYTGNDPDRVSVHKGRGNENIEKGESLFSRYQGGIAAALSLDMVKNPFVGTTLQSAGVFYDFTIEGTVSIDGKTFYEVGFKPKEDADPFLFVGKVFIEEESLAIGRIEFSMDIEGKQEEAAGEFILKRSADTDFSIRKADYLVNFKEFDGKWYFDYCKSDIAFTARKKHSLSKSRYSISSEMVVTDHKEDGFHITNDQKIRYRNFLSEGPDSFRNKGFWEDMNVIEPELHIEKAIHGIVGQLQKQTARE